MLLDAVTMETEIRQQAAGKKALSTGQRPGHIPQLKNRSVNQQDGNISLPDAARCEERQGACRLHMGLRRKEDCRQTGFSLGTCKLCIRAVDRRALSL